MTSAASTILPRPSPVPAPFINMATYLAPTLSTIMLPDAKRLASIVHSALVVHFATDESLKTWPPCLENHIVNFLHGAQLPQEYVATALALLAQLSFDNPYLYAENDDAECLFYAAMYTVAERYADYKNYYPEAERFARFQFQFHDRRWSGRTWKAILNNIKNVLDIVWNQSQWMNLLDIDNLVSQSRPFVRTRDEYVKAGRSEWIRARFFNEVIRGVMEGDNLVNPDRRRKALSGPLRMKPASIDCLLYCCFERGDKYPMPNDAPGGLPIHLGYRPWNTNDPYGSDYKHNTNGNLDIWTKGEKPETNPQVKFYHTVVIGPYQSFSLMSFRENGVPWNLNAEEKEMWKDWETHLCRIRLLPPSNEMEKKLAKAIKKERAAQRMAEKEAVNVAPSMSGSSSGSASGSGTEGEVESKTPLPFFPATIPGTPIPTIRPAAPASNGVGPAPRAAPRRVPVGSRYNV